jgi:SAM-dependent methyltransferase
LNAAGALSFFLPAGLGVFEGTSAYLFGVLGLGGPQGVVFGLVRRARMILISAAGVVLHWLGRNAMAQADRAASSDRWRTLRRYAYTWLRAPRGIGRPQPAAQWDAEYSDGKWRKLDSAAQLGHYALISGYVKHFFPAAPSIVDVGCGHGRLFQLLRQSGYRRYVGLDLSAEAIEEARSTACENARFEVTDFASWSSSERFDVIIFNESIYYATDPLQQLARYAGLLTKDGLIVLSIVQSAMNAGIARRIRRQFEVLHSSIVRNECGERWEVSVVRCKATPPSSSSSSSRRL